ncbi:hypothetical protein [Candidatus Poriferisodalis sp.]|uniref:hypothetical protein n=1 Tax=Candidatus Poriferisodalis sp. TaxID=3101277 RepID=UPI003B015074
MSEAGASVASHLLQAERIATALQDSVRWRDSFGAITAEHNKAMQAVLGSATAAAATRSAFANISRHTDSLAAARAAMAPSVATTLAAAVKHNYDIQKVLDATNASAAMPSVFAKIGRHTDSLAAVGAAMGPNAATTLAAAVKHNYDIQKALGATGIGPPAQSTLTGIGLQADSLKALGAAVDPGVDKLAKALHSQFDGITNVLKSYRIDPAVLPHRQMSEIMRQLSMRPDLAAVAESAASLARSVGLSRELAADIQHIAHAANRADMAADLVGPRDHDPISHDGALHEIVEPSLEEADFSLLLILVVMAVFPALLATSTAYVTQAAQDLLFMLRLLGKLTQVDDAIPGVLLLNAVIRSIRRPRGEP